MPLPCSDDLLLRLLEALRRRDYRFVTPTPATHQRVVARPGWNGATDLRGIFGWSLPFEASVLDEELRQLVVPALTEPAGAALRSRVRVSSLGDQLFVHSPFPTTAEDAVFFGPDTYRFADLIERELADVAGGTIDSILDVGTGSGAGAIIAAKCTGGSRVVGTDVNAEALRVAAINARAAEVPLETRSTDEDDQVRDRFALVLANPPYIIDAKGRDYRDGGGLYGGELSVEMTTKALDRLSSSGRMILYTGAAIVNGRNLLAQALTKLADRRGLALRLREIDPDVFGEELSGESYRDVERIAVISAVFRQG